MDLVNFDDELCDVVLQATYGLAKGRAGVPVRVGAVANQTGLDEAEVSRTVDLLVRKGRLLAPSPDSIALSPPGMAAAKADAEYQSGVAFTDGR